MTRFFIKVPLICLIAVLTLHSTARAIMNDDGFTRGNALYAAGDDAGAVRAYEGQLSRGEYTANLFYNLGNAYYRQRNRGRAILNYQRALILDPSHAEAAANLAFVRGVKPTAPASAGWVTTALPWLTAAAFWLGAAGLVIAVSGRRARAIGLSLLATGLLACVSGVAAMWSLDDSAGNAARAVVVADSVPALYAPADNSKVITRLTAGSEVRVLSDQGAWLYALLNDGTRAWLASDKIERIVPR